MAQSDVRVRDVVLYYLPIRTRVPVKFGPEILTEVTCARARVVVQGRDGLVASGWGETPLSVQWVWPSSHPYEARLRVLEACTEEAARRWTRFREWGCALELGWRFHEEVLPEIERAMNARAPQAGHADLGPLPHLAALVCSSPFDIALHDAFARMQGRGVYECYSPELVPGDLSRYIEPAQGSGVSFRSRYVADFLASPPATTLKAWHLVAGLDPLRPSELMGDEPDDGYPVLLEDWIRRDGLGCLKVKLRGTDTAWDVQRILTVGGIAAAHGVDWLSADFNCTVNEPRYVEEALDRVRDAAPQTYGRILYVEQPFPYDLEAHRIDVRSVAARKPLFMDESAHDWRLLRLGRELGWSGVALKTCKTQTSALLSLCWARAHGMPLMVQDLANPMLAQISHLSLAAHAGTIMGVETNSMQFYPEASLPEAAVHPGIYARRDGCVDLSTLGPMGFGYREQEIRRRLPEPAWQGGQG